MAGWFPTLMQKGHPRSGRSPDPRDARYDAIVQTLRDLEAEDRAAREKRQRGYRQSLESDSGLGSSASSPSSPVRLNKFRTKVPCRVTPEARALLDRLR